MSKIRELLRQGRYDELWQMCCGFINFSLEQFMFIQRRLLKEQIELLKNSPLGRRVMREAMPETVEEFREKVPLTIYADYCPELLERQEDILPAKPLFWQYTPGRSGEYPAKWVPITQGFYEEWGKVCIAAALFATSKRKGEVALREGWKLLYTSAPRPHTSGYKAQIVAEQIGCKYLPSLEEAESMNFEERMREGFKRALSQGMKGIFGLAEILIAIGEQFQSLSKKINILSLISQPRACLRLVTGVIKSKLAWRPLLPKDLWSLKGIVTSGTDNPTDKEKIKNLWGKYPLDVYICGEGGIIAMQTWDYNTMTFVPTLNFLEFIPETEYLHGQSDLSHQPKTILLDEVKAGENYEIVITNFHGGTFIRYRPGDIVRIISLRNENLGINIPQMVFKRQADNPIDTSFIRLTKKIIWQAIENTEASTSTIIF